MKVISLLKRAWNITKVGKAIHAMRDASDEDKKTWANHYLVELLGQSRGLSIKIG